MSFSSSIKRAAFCLFALLLLPAASLFGQAQWKLPLYINDSFPKRDTLTFGVHPLASYCFDPGIWFKFGECDSLMETQQPPFPPAGNFDVRFVDSRSGSSPECPVDNGLGTGMDENIQGYTAPGSVDTFQVRLQPQAAPGGYPFTISWPKNLTGFADSIIVKDPLGLPPGVGGFRVDMLQTDSVRVTQQLITSVIILVYHPKAYAFPPLPTLSSPADNATDVDTNVTFTWTGSADVSNYVFQVSDSANFSTLVRNDILTTTSTSIKLPANRVFYWRVSANHRFQTGCFSAGRKFTMITTGPAAPDLVSPANGATNVALSPTLSWNASATATSYRLEVSPNPNFTVLDFVDSTITGTSQQVGPLLNCVTRYWRVKASNASGSSPWSVVRSFTTILVAPGAPTLSSPPDNATGLSTSPTLSWTGADSCSKSYRLEVSLDSAFTSPLVFNNLTTTSQTVNNLDELTKYFWRVSAANVGNEGGYSVIRRFTTLLNPPGAPTLSSPANGDTTVPPSPVLRWMSDTHVDTFEVQVASDAGFTVIVRQASTPDTAYQPAALSNCAMYYWRVRGKNSSGTGAYASRSFTVVRALSSAPTLLTPADGTVNVDEMAVLTWAAEACAFEYRVEVSKDSLFGSHVADQTVSALTITVGPLDGNTDHFWRVTGVNNIGQGTPSGTFKFRTTALTTPPKPVLLSPTNGAQSLALPVTLCWDSAARAVSYRLQVAIDSNFSTLTYNDTSGALVRCRQFTFLLNSTTYYWRVNATNAAGTSAYSDVFRFATLSPPAAPTLISPVNNAEGVTAAPVLVWSVPQNAVSYRLQVARDTGFTSIFSDDSNLVNTSWQTGPLQSHTRYYWRVLAKNSVGIGPWSPRFTFRTTFIGVANWLMPLAVRETGQARDTIYLGLHPDATCGIEPWLGEFELPPPPFAGTFDARFVSTANAACDIGEGLRVNLLPFNTYTQVDTYRVRFQTGTGSYPVTFSWNNIFIRSVCDSMVLKDEFGGSSVYSRMDLDNSASIPNSSVSSILMIRYGAFPLINDVRPPAPRTPTGYMLAQNYPNPFNPTTRIAFSTEHSAHITVTVFDLLGREVSVLADDDYYEGVYSVTWNATNASGVQMPSGVYYVRMTASPRASESGSAGSYSETRKMLLLK